MCWPFGIVYNFIFGVLLLNFSGFGIFFLISHTHLLRSASQLIKSLSLSLYQYRIVYFISSATFNRVEIIDICKKFSSILIVLIFHMIQLKKIELCFLFDCHEYIGEGLGKSKMFSCLFVFELLTVVCQSKFLDFENFINVSCFLGFN